MPVTTRLLQRLQETLGDEATNDLVTWVDHATETSVGRFEAKLEQRLVELKAEFRVDLAHLENRIDTGLAALRAEMAAQRSDLLKWMFIFWVGTIVPLAGLMITLVKLVRP